MSLVFFGPSPQVASQVEASLRQVARKATGVVEEQLAAVRRQEADEILRGQKPGLIFLFFFCLVFFALLFKGFYGFCFAFRHFFYFFNLDFCSLPSFWSVWMIVGGFFWKVYRFWQLSSCS